MEISLFSKFDIEIRFKDLMWYCCVELFEMTNLKVSRDQALVLDELEVHSYVMIADNK